MGEQKEAECIQWEKYYNDMPFHLYYPDETIYGMVRNACEAYPDNIAADFMGKKIRYKQLGEEIVLAAAAFAGIGIAEGDAVTVALPNSPQALYCFYGLNKIGAVPSMIHPLSVPKEISFYLTLSESKAIVVLDSFYEKASKAVAEAEKALGREIKMIVASVQDELPFPKNVLFAAANRRKTPDIDYSRDGGRVIPWKRFINTGKSKRDALSAEEKKFSGAAKQAVSPASLKTGCVAENKASEADKVAVTRMTADAADKVAVTRMTADAADKVAVTRMTADVADKVAVIRMTADTADKVAVILYSGGTTGTSKGIQLTNRNINALAMQTLAASGTQDVLHDKMLSVMPMFHGFGLGIGIHLPLICGAQCILVPQFSVKGYAKILKQKKPNFIPGVPTLFEALLRTKNLEKTDLSFLKGVFSGGDSLSVELKKKVDAFLTAHGATVQIREGYGLTECVTASCLTPPSYNREGSIGIPFPDTYYTIVKAGSTEPLPCGEEGEICLRGPSVMKGYLKNEEETAQALRIHADGNVWLHTGDLGFIDGDGFVYFRQRIKRMIVTSGYNVYPSQVENILDAHEKVLLSCVIGVKDPYKMQRIKAFVVLKQGISPEEGLKQELIAYCRENIARYAAPSEIEFREDLPKTLVGKVNYRLLEEEEAAKTC